MSYLKKIALGFNILVLISFIISITTISALADGLIPVMTSATTPSGEVSSSGTPYYSACDWKAFNGVKSNYSGYDMWQIWSTTGWLRYKFPSPQIVNKYIIYDMLWDQYSIDPKAPKNWTFEGSNDGINWTVLQTVANHTSCNSYVGNVSYNWYGITTFYPVNYTAYTYYRINITANNGGSYLAINELEMYTQPIPPSSAPAGLTAAASYDSIRLTWNSVQTASSYNVKRSESSSGPYTAILTGITSTDFSDINLARNKTYWYKVSAVNPFGEGPDSSAISAATSDNLNLIPIMTSATTPIGEVSSSGTPYYSASDWKAFNGVKSNYSGYDMWQIWQTTGWLKYKFPVPKRVNKYIVYDMLYDQYSIDPKAPKNWTFEASNDGTNWIVLQTVTNHTSCDSYVGTASYNRYGITTFCLTNDTFYTYYRINVTANNGGSYLAINELELYGQSLQVPDEPLNFTATAGDGQVTLGWSAVSGASSYNIKRCLSQNGTYSNIQTGDTNTTYTDTGLTNGTTYYYKVSAVNLIGEGVDSDSVSVRPVHSTVPSKPLNLVAVSGDCQVILYWDSADQATSYNVKRSVTENGTYTTIKTGLTDTIYIDTEVTNGTMYYYKVSATNSLGESLDSDYVSVTPLATVESIVATPTQISLNIGQTQLLVIKANYSDGSQQDVSLLSTYSSADSNLASVSTSGLLEAKYEGSTSINIEYYGKTTSVNVAVADPNSSFWDYKYDVNPNEGIDTDQEWGGSDNDCPSYTWGPYCGQYCYGVICNSSAQWYTFYRRTAPTATKGLAISKYTDFVLESRLVSNNMNYYLRDDDNLGLMVKLESSGLKLYLSDRSYELIPNTGIISDNKWHAIRLRKNGLQYGQVYLDGNLVKDNVTLNDISGVHYYGNFGYVGIGAGSGYIDSVKYSAKGMSDIKSLKVTPAAVELNQGETQQLVVKGVLSDGSETDITQNAIYSISDTSIAGVNNAGLITAHYPGTTSVSVAYDGRMTTVAMSVYDPLEGFWDYKYDVNPFAGIDTDQEWGGSDNDYVGYTWGPYCGQNFYGIICDSDAQWATFYRRTYPATKGLTISQNTDFVLESKLISTNMDYYLRDDQNLGLKVKLVSSGLKLFLPDGSYEMIPNTGILGDGKWHSIRLRKNGLQYGQVYLDGILIKENVTLCNIGGFNYDGNFGYVCSGRGIGYIDSVKYSAKGM
jgi:hypothetical protein